MEKTTVRRYKKRTTAKPNVEKEALVVPDVAPFARNRLSPQATAGREEKMSVKVEDVTIEVAVVEEAKAGKDVLPEEEVKEEEKVLLEEVGEAEEPATTNEVEDSTISDKEAFWGKPEEKTSNKLFKVSMFVLLLLLLANAVFFFFLIRNLQKPAPAKPTAVVSTATPAPEVDKSEWIFEVLNGSGVAGLAGKVADELTSAGYSVVETGNADTSDYSETQILVKSVLKDKVDLLITDLKDIVKISTVAGELTDSTASARIILGKDQ